MIVGISLPEPLEIHRRGQHLQRTAVGRNFIQTLLGGPIQGRFGIPTSDSAILANYMPAHNANVSSGVQICRPVAAVGLPLAEVVIVHASFKSPAICRSNLADNGRKFLQTAIFFLLSSKHGL